MEDIYSNGNEVQQVKIKITRPTCTYAILTINVLVWLFTVYYSYKYGGSSGNDLGTKVNSRIMSGEYWRLFTPMFLHANIVHLAINSYSLFAIGPLVEKIFGYKKFIAIYLAAGIMGNISSFIFSSSDSLGASGAIFGLLGALLYLWQKHRRSFASSFGTSIIAMILINIVYGFSHAGIDNFAHLGGLTGGYLAALGVGFAGEKVITGKRMAIIALTLLLAFGGIFAGFINPRNIEQKNIYAVDNNTKKIVDSASASFTNKDYKKAEELAREILKSGSKDDFIVINGNYYLAASLLNQGKFDEALPYAKTLANIYPKLGHHILGLIYYNKGEKDLAKVELKRAYELDPSNTQAKEILDQLQGN